MLALENLPGLLRGEQHMANYFWYINEKCYTEGVKKL